jgi:hypothetical protein
MQAGAWKLAQPLIFDEDAMLDDGQNRLLAAYFGNVPLTTTVIVVPKQDQLFTVLDCGKPRTAGDAIFTAGYNGQSSAIASAVSLLWRYDNHLLRVHEQPKIRKMENKEVLDYALAHSDVGDTAHLIVANFPRIMKTIGNKGVAVAFSYLVRETFGQEVLMDFLKPLVTGANLGEDSIILALRNRLMVNDDDEKMKAPHRFALLIKGFKMHRLGHKASRKGLFLRDNEKYPRIEDTEIVLAAE